MQLKHYQQRVLSELSAYLKELKAARDAYESGLAHDDSSVRDLAADYDFAKKAWNEARRGGYFSKRDGLGNPLPDVYLKVPTGGGKTLLACHALESISREYLHRQGGVVLWIVPSEQIYSQTLQQLRDRTHPYRQVLDIASGGCTSILERKARFSPQQVEGRLVVLLLMLQASNRENKETLRMFRDGGGFAAFLPDEGDRAQHAALVQQVGNLDTFGEAQDLFGVQVVSSLGNVLRLLRPLVVLDEGQKAYSKLARETLYGFNPAFVLELSATPPPQSNVVAVATGRDLDEEQMIKLDIHLYNRATPDWKQVLLAAVDKRVELERAATAYQQNGNRYIRPLALVQVERTGKGQREGQYIHAEAAREYLIKQCGVLPQHIAIKSAEQNELSGVDLFAETCQIRYVITKQALQEGWDCAFAYVLVVLSNLQAKVSMTQLVGRILRQPDARKTGIAALDECYVFTHRRDSGSVVTAIKQELEAAGLGDLAGRIAGDVAAATTTPNRTLKFAEQFKHFKGRIYLPQFVVGPKEQPRPLDYESDILAELPWAELNCARLQAHGLEEVSLAGHSAVGGVRIGLEDVAATAYNANAGGGLAVDAVLMTRQLVEVMPNPWRAYRLAKDILRFFTDRVGAATTARHFVFLIEESKRVLTTARDAMAKAFFDAKIERGDFALVLFTGEGAWRIPHNVTLRSDRRMQRADGGYLQQSLLEYVPEEDTTEFEKKVALFLDEHAQLLWWYRNRVPGGYALQGWKRNRIYADFIAATKAAPNATASHSEVGEVLVVETKGEHLAGNTDTEYKRSVLELCTELCAHAGTLTQQPWPDLADGFNQNKFRFQVVDQHGWQSALNGLLKGS